MDYATEGPRTASPEPMQRGVDRFFNAEQEQLLGLSGLMRRSEDLADRICGSTPSSAEKNDARHDPSSSLLGALGMFHNNRDAMIDRISGALSRIEEIL